MDEVLQRRWCHTEIDSTSASTLAVRPKVGERQLDSKEGDILLRLSTPIVDTF
jgi:hypothetical protein